MTKKVFNTSFKAKNTLLFCLLAMGFTMAWMSSPALISPFKNALLSPMLKADSDSVIHLRYPFEDHILEDENGTSSSPLFLHDPSNVIKTVEYNPDENQYDINEGIGRMFYRNPSYLTFDEFVDGEFRKSQINYFKQRSEEENVVKKNALIPVLHVNNEVFDLIFGGNTVDIKPNGSAELLFGLRRSTNENPSLPVRSQKPPPQFDFNQKIQMNVIGNIGDKMKITTSYNTESQFDFENQMKIEYTGYEDEIIKKIEMGNVSLPLTSSLITGSQSLFGIKTALQFGRLKMTSIYSQQKGKKQTVESQGGAQTSFYEVKADQYEANKHFFLAQYFKDNYDKFLSELPEVKSPVNISRVEVWVTRKQGNVDNIRNIAAILDLGERTVYNTGVTFGSVSVGPDTLNVPYPSNYSNNIYRNVSQSAGIRDINSVKPILDAYGFVGTQDYEKLEARLLASSEYTVNSRLGYISLNQTLNPNEVLAVSFEYTIGGNTYRVGEFSNGGIAAPSALLVKLLKGTVFTTKLPTWDLMMKNIYSIGAFQINREDFKLNIMYDNAASGIPVNYLPAGGNEPKVNGVNLLKVLNLDKTNAQNDPQPNGEFDFMEGLTINADKGRIIFPVREPFGSFLRSKFLDQATANQYAFDFLYDSTKTRAQQDLEHNRYSLKGSYKSTSGSEINLNAFNIPQGSVTVTAGGVKLVENADYTVDYNLGKVKIINAAYLNSNTPIKCELESNSAFSFQTKTLFGTRLDYYINKDFSLGGTLLHLSERPITQKVSIGDESISNTIWGVDGTYKTDSRLLTRIIDKLPLYDTKEVSTITLAGEYARLQPGHSRQIDNKTGGTAYIDDFEGTKSTIDIKSPSLWTLASVPQFQPTLFREAQYTNDLRTGFNRARLGWFVIDPFFFESKAPDNIKNNPDELSYHYSRQVLETEIFPNKENANNQQSVNLSVLNLAYYPSERGPYNFDKAASDVSMGSLNGILNNPETRWGGMMRKLETTDFEATNVEFIEFWMMDPFIYNPTSSGGDLYFNLGNISEDILKDGIKNFENGLPIAENPIPTTTAAFSDSISVWGRIPLQQSVVNAFDNNPASRPFQDVGLDGIDNAHEQVFFNDYIGYDPGAANDPAADDYHHFRGTDYDNEGLSILQRYKRYNGLEGNSVTTERSPEAYPTSSTTLPDMEDINKDGMFSENEGYYQYKVSIKPGAMQNVGENFITDKLVTPPISLPNGKKESVTWYQFKIPINTPKSEKVGSIEDFHSVNFIRMFMRGFSDSLVCRFGKLQLVRSDWRRFPNDVGEKGAYVPIDNDKTVFDVTTVSIEENGNREPIKYVLPPGILRQRNAYSTNNNQLNEQSLVLQACGLADGSGRAAYKNISFDIRNYKKIRMYVHAEAGSGTDALKKGDLKAFIRLGNDFENNYYEYEINLTPTNWGASSDVEIWPDANTMLIDLEKLYNAKLDRNALNWAINKPYSVMDGENRITVVGSPRLNELHTIMLGIRNPYRYTSDSDDGLPKCAEVWFDELRVTDFDDKGGWAANARLSAKLADLGNVNVSGIHKSANWGSLEQKLNERSKNTETSYDASGTTELGKFLPEKSKLKIPVYMGYAEVWKRPKFDPYDPDVPLQNELDHYKTTNQDARRKEIIHQSEDYTVRRSLNFTNVKKEKGAGKKSHFYDVENVSLNYAYTDLYNRSESIQYKYQKTHRGGIAYVFGNTPKNVAPFAKSKALKSNWFKLIKDFNFQYSPSSVAFRTDLDRQYNEMLLRNTTGSPFGMDTNFNKSFSMSRNYDVKYDMTKSLKFDFQANNSSRVDEGAGRINRKDQDYQQAMDTIKNNLFGIDAPLGGRTTDYHHTGNVNYTIPINKIPILDWITPTSRYGYDYHWVTAPYKRDSLTYKMRPDTALGNTITNSKNIQLSANLNFTNFYNKVNYFKRVNQMKPGQVFPKRLKPIKTHEDSLRAKQDSLFHASAIGQVLHVGTKFLLAVKTGSLSFTSTDGTILPGYLQRTQFMGMDDRFEGPTTGFIFGSQKDIRMKAGDKNWITHDTLLNLPYTKTHMDNIMGKVNIEPLPGFKIDLNVTRNYTLNHSEYFHYYSDSTGTSGYKGFSPTETGNFSMSYFSLNTAFEKQSKPDYTSAAFENFKAYRTIISERLSSENPNASQMRDTAGYYKGYGSTSQEVLIPAFLAAYGSNHSPENESLANGSSKHAKHSLFAAIPIPNWRISYDGLSKLEATKKYFNTVTISHGYRSTYNINNFTTSTLFIEDINGHSLAVNDTGDFRSRFEIGQISIAEQFSPLLGIDMNWKSGFTNKLEYKRDRNISLNLANTNVNETRGAEYVLGMGYKLKNYKIPFKINAQTVRLKNDLIFKTDFSYRRSLTISRALVQETVQPTGGMRTKKISTSIEYMVNERFNLKLFHEWSRNIPEISTSFKTTNWNAGFSIRFTLS